MILQYYSQAENIDTMCASMLKLAQTHCPLVTEATILFGKFIGSLHSATNYEKITELGRF